MAFDRDRVAVGLQQARNAAEQLAARWLDGRLAGVEQQLVGQHADHQAARAQRRVDLVADAVLLGVGIDLALERLEVLVLLAGPSAPRTATSGRRTLSAGIGGAAAARSGVFSAPPASVRPLPPGRTRPEKASSSDALQRLELGRVHRRDREQHHEQRHQQRDHVGVGEQPALVVAVRRRPRRRGAGRRLRDAVALMATPPPRPARPLRRRRRRRMPRRRSGRARARWGR